MTNTPLAWHATSRTGAYTFDVRPSTAHEGTFVLRVAQTDDNKTLARFNSFATVAEALERAATWRAEQPERREDDTER